MSGAAAIMRSGAPKADSAIKTSFSKALPPTRPLQLMCGATCGECHQGGSKKEGEVAARRKDGVKCVCVNICATLVETPNGPH